MKWFLLPISSDEQAAMLTQWLKAQDFPEAESLADDPRPTAKKKVQRIAIGAMIAVVLLAGIAFWQTQETEALQQDLQLLKTRVQKQEMLHRTLQDSILSQEVQLIELKKIVPDSTSN
ncbi:MAG: hypothetical protein AAF740_14955 [Bacteroidota bacterium]